MKQEINVYQFEQEFKNMDRDYYSWEGYQALYDYYDEFEKKQHIYKEVKIVQKWLNDKDKVI